MTRRIKVVIKDENEKKKKKKKNTFLFFLVFNYENEKWTTRYG